MFVLFIAVIFMVLFWLYGRPYLLLLIQTIKKKKKPKKLIRDIYQSARWDYEPGRPNYDSIRATEGYSTATAHPADQYTASVIHSIISEGE